MILSIFKAFFKTAVFGYRMMGDDDVIRVDLKRQWAQMILKTFEFTLDIQGTPPLSGAMIIVGNHISFLDIAVLMAAQAEVTFIAKEDLKKWPIIGAGASAAGTLFVNRQKGKDRKAVRDQIVHVLKNKKTSIVVFPSGTTTLYEEAPWKRGAFEIAKQANVPVQLFRIDYKPLRESAYIDDDNLLLTMLRLSKIRNKSVSLRWLDQFNQIDDPDIFSEQLRLMVTASQNPNGGHNEA